MCGATGTQQQLSQEELDAYTQAQTLTAAQYGKQSAIYAALTPQFESIFAGGPNQPGFSQAEKQSLDSQAVEGTAENFKQAETAVGENEAAEGGGDAILPTGGQQQLKEEVGNSAAAEESKEETGITQADYAQGYDEWQKAGAGLDAIATGENPLGYEGAESTSGSVANTAAEDVANEQNSWINAALGAAGTIGGAAAGAEVKALNQ